MSLARQREAFSCRKTQGDLVPRRPGCSSTSCEFILLFSGTPRLPFSSLSALGPFFISRASGRWRALLRPHSSSCSSRLKENPCKTRTSTANRVSFFFSYSCFKRRLLMFCIVPVNDPPPPSKLNKLFGSRSGTCGDRH